MSLIGNQTSIVALSDSVEIAPNGGFYVDRDCTLVFEARGDATSRTWAFLRDQFYDIDIRLAFATGSTAGTQLLVVVPRVVR
ncbi:MAG: hypothetical protein ACYTKD_29135 [Planctomycetota bacterium]|jgi:hypothetical protein